MVEKKSANKRILRLLIVDDSPDDADALSKNLRIARFMLKTNRVTDAAGMQTALQKNKWDLVVSDFKLKNFNGNLAIDTLKRISPTIPLIIFTQDLGDTEMVEIMRAGARDVVLKSRPARIIPVIERELDVAAARKEYRRIMHLAKEMEDKHKAIVEGSKDALCYCHDGMHIDANQIYVDMFGYKNAKELEVIPVLDLIDREDQEEFKKVLRKASQKKDIDGALEFTSKRKDGTRFNIEMTIGYVDHKGEHCLQLTFKDITKRKAAENRLKYLSQRDPLTGLYNRHHFTKLLSDAVEKAKTSSKPSVMIYIDLYDLQEINNKLGYTAGDRALLKITKMFREKVGEDAIVARIGGDEFCILLEGKTESHGEKARDKIKKLFSKALLSEKGKTHDCNCATSIIIIDKASGPAQDIITQAANASEKDRPHQVPAAVTAAPAKEPTVVAETPLAAPTVVAETPQVSADKPSDNVPVEAAPKPAEPKKKVAASVDNNTSSLWQERIQNALRDNRFKLVYQPIINLHGDADEYFEVLVRMVGEDGQLIAPGNFMAEAERTGIIKDIDYWVTEHAIDSLSTLHAEGRKAQFFINLSKNTFEDIGYIGQVKTFLSSKKINSKYLVFELDESDIIEHSEETNKVIVDRLTSLGSKISIDNCGLSLDVVLNLPKHSVKYIKLTDSIVKTAAENIDKRDSLTAMLAMALKLEVKSVAKGIENAHALTDLWTFGFQYVQGNYFQHADAEINYDFTPEDETELSSDSAPSAWSR